jgi:hypothetical protein
MSVMEPSTASQPATSESPRTDAAETGRTEKAHRARHFESTKLPSLGGTGPILPEWLRKRFRRKDTPAAR